MKSRALEGRKVGSLKRRVRSQLARWEMKKCTPLWREAHLQVKNVQNTPCSDHFWKFEMSKKCTPLWREAHFEVKMYKAHQVRTTFGSWDVEKVHAVVARSTFRSQNVQNTPASDHFWKLRCRKVHAVVARSTFRSENAQNTRGSDHFWRFRCRFAWQAHGIVHLFKSEQNVRVLWHCQKRWQAWDIWRGSAKMHFPWQAQYKRHVHERC